MGPCCWQIPVYYYANGFGDGTNPYGWFVAVGTETLNMSAWDADAISIIGFIQCLPTFDVESSAFPVTSHAAVGSVVFDRL